MLNSTITDQDVAVGVRAVVIAARVLLGKLDDPEFVPLDSDVSPIVVDDAAAPDDEQSARGDRLRGFARRGGQFARQSVASGIGRWSGDRPGSAGWNALDRDRRSDWWMSTVGRMTAVVAALPGLAGAVGERVPVKDLVSAAGQALLLCAIAHEYGLQDTDDYVELVASVILDRDLSGVGRSAAQPAEREAEHLTDGIRTAPSGTMARLLATGTSLMRIGRRLHALQHELDKRPRGHAGQRLAGSLPVVGLVGQYRGERRGLRIVSDRGRRWCAERIERQVHHVVPAPPDTPWSPPARPFMGEGSPYDEMRSVMVLVEKITRRHYPAAIVDGANYSGSPSWRFGIESPDGIALVWADVRDIEFGESWHMQFTAGLAHSVTDVRGALEWVNERNQLTTMGRYYCSTTHDGKACAVLWEGSIWSRIVTDLRPVTTVPTGVVTWIAQLVHMSYETPTECRAVLHDLGGHPYRPGPPGMIQVEETA